MFIRDMLMSAIYDIAQLNHRTSVQMLDISSMTAIISKSNLRVRIYGAINKFNKFDHNYFHHSCDMSFQRLTSFIFLPFSRFANAHY